MAVAGCAVAIAGRPVHRSTATDAPHVEARAEDPSARRVSPPRAASGRQVCVRTRSWAGPPRMAQSPRPRDTTGRRCRPGALRESGGRCGHAGLAWGLSAEPPEQRWRVRPTRWEAIRGGHTSRCDLRMGNAFANAGVTVGKTRWRFAANTRDVAQAQGGQEEKDVKRRKQELLVSSIGCMLRITCIPRSSGCHDRKRDLRFVCKAPCPQKEGEMAETKTTASGRTDEQPPRRCAKCSWSTLEESSSGAPCPTPMRRRQHVNECRRRQCK